MLKLLQQTAASQHRQLRSAQQWQLKRTCIVSSSSAAARAGSSSRRVWATRSGRKGHARVTLIDRTRTHLWKPLLHEVAAGSMDLDQHELDYLAQARWHHFRFQLGEMDGLDRARREVIVGPVRDEDGEEIIPRTRDRLRHAGHRCRQPHQRFRHAGRARIRHRRSIRRAMPSIFTGGWSTPACARTPSASRCAPSNCTSRSSARARRAWSSPRNCTRPRASCSRSGSSASIPSATCSSRSSRPRRASCPRCRSGSRKQRKSCCTGSTCRC